MISSLLLGAALLGQARDAKTLALVPQLISSDRVERHKAAAALVALPTLPESALPNITGYLKLEVTQAMVPDFRPVRGGGERLDRIPVVGDELSIPRIKANPDQHFETPFVLSGAIGISDYYNFGFDNAQDDYYSFQLDVAARDGQTGDSVHVYMRRFDGAALAERITRTQERQHNAGMAVRLRCVIHRNRTRGDISTATNSIEATDWQVLNDDNTWTPWTFEAISTGYAMMYKAGKASTVACLDLIMNEQEFQTPKADAMLKGTAISYLLGLPAKDRNLALKRVSLRAKRVKSAVAKDWTRRVYASLESGRLLL